MSCCLPWCSTEIGVRWVRKLLLKSSSSGRCGGCLVQIQSWVFVLILRANCSECFEAMWKERVCSVTGTTPEHKTSEHCRARQQNQTHASGKKSLRMSQGPGSEYCQREFVDGRDSMRKRVACSRNSNAVVEFDPAARGAWAARAACPHSACHPCLVAPETTPRTHCSGSVGVVSVLKAWLWALSGVSLARFNRDFGASTTAAMPVEPLSVVVAVSPQRPSFDRWQSGTGKLPHEMVEKRSLITTVLRLTLRIPPCRLHSDAMFQSTDGRMSLFY
jgi:hypothetical protein